VPVPVVLVDRYRDQNFAPRCDISATTIVAVSCSVLQHINPRPRASGAFFLCARHGVDAGGGSPLRALMVGTASRRQLRRREAGWGGSRRLNSEPTDRNRISGRRGGVTRQWTGTPESHSDTQVGRSGGRRGQESQLTLGGLSLCLGNQTTAVATRRDGTREVSRGHSSSRSRQSY
jgi:hypothetical protein